MTSEHRHFDTSTHLAPFPPALGELNRFSLQQQHEFSIGHRRRGTGIAKGMCEDLSDRLEGRKDQERYTPNIDAVT